MKHRASQNLRSSFINFLQPGVLPESRNASPCPLAILLAQSLKHVLLKGRLDNTVNELNSWVATDRGAEAEQNFSLEKMESTLGELKNIFKEKERLVENL